MFFQRFLKNKKRNKLLKIIYKNAMLTVLFGFTDNELAATKIYEQFSKI